MSNLYTKRSVAQKDSQPCLVCFLPTTCVLYNSSIQDWFYCCELHFKDNPGFAKPVYSTNYNDAIERLKVVKQKLDAEKLKQAGSWDSWVNKLISKKASKESPEKITEQGTESQNEEAKTETATELQLMRNEYQRLTDVVSKGQKELRSFTLSPVMFESRLDAKKRSHFLRQKAKREQDNYSNTNPEELTSKFNFPAVPKT
ncbi:LAFA_0D11562g1_1 [Lachancea sp. 'fantastica']|nr:LAFA_0D11562g1_1 [Lachancea sp. 'fantastica']